MCGGFSEGYILKNVNLVKLKHLHLRPSLTSISVIYMDNCARNVDRYCITECPLVFTVTKWSINTNQHKVVFVKYLRVALISLYGSVIVESVV